VFEGLDHLEGQEVGILADGVVYPRQTVSNGTITLPDERDHVYIGLPYNSDFETLDIAKTDNKGMVKGRPVKISNVTFQYLNSRGGWIGPDFDNLYEAFVPETDDVSQAPDLETGVKRLSLGAGYSEGGRVCYRQVDPLPVTLIATVPEVSP
jgi:hypothetical protein